jgi:golgin subfamily B member 1
MAELSERAAVLHEDQLGDVEGAVPYLERILELDPVNERAFERLKTILNAIERWSDLEKLYIRTIEVTRDEATRVELLHEAAVIAEDMVGNDERAIAFYEEMVGIDPLHEAATEALDRLYGREERWSDLARLLERRLETATEDDVVGLQLRLVDIYLHRLEAHDRVMTHLESLLGEHHGHLDARALAEECLGIPALRQPAATLLDSVYEAVDDPRDLVRILIVRLEGVESDDHERELLHRIATLQDQRLKNDAGAFETLSRLLPLEPDDAVIRGRLLEVGRRLGEHEKMARTLLATAERATLPNTRGEILMAAAALFRDRLEATDQAEKVYRQILAIDPDDPELVIPAAKRLAEIYHEVGKHDKLAEVLAIQVRLVSEPSETKALYARIATLYEDLLDDDVQAIEAWKARVAEDASDVEALRSLERLYERGEKWRNLVDTLRQLEQIAFDGDERKRCMTKAAEVLARELDETDEAINAWRAVLDDFGPERDTLAALADLYRKAERWDDLAEAIDLWLQLADDTDERVGLHARLGDVRRDHLQDPTGALTAYRDVLVLDRSHAGARQALEAMLEHDEPEIKREAAEILGPIYDDEGEAEKLLKVLDIEIEATYDPIARLETLERALQTAEDTLESPERAFDYACRGVKEGLGEPRLRAWIDLAERLGTQIGRHEALLELYENVIPDMLDAEIQQRTRLRAGELARDDLGDKPRAVGHYRAALEAVADDRRAMIALEELYGEMGDHAALLEILRMRAEAADDEADRIELLFRVAELQAGPLEQPSEAIVTYEDIVSTELDRRAIAALEKLYAEANRYDDLVRLIERQLDEASGEKAADLRVSIARISHTHLHDNHRALDELGEALGADSDHSGAIASLERLLGEAPEPEQRARVAEMLEPVYLSSHDWTKLEGALKARLETAGDPEDKGELLSRLATLYEEQLENYEEALAMNAERLRDDPTDEAIWHEVERLGRVIGDTPTDAGYRDGGKASSSRRVAEIFARALEPITVDDPQTARLSQRAGELYAEAEAHEEALRWLRRAQLFERESTELFEAIDRILVAAKRREERIEHYRAALDHTFDDDVRVRYLHVIAGLQWELERFDDAIATFSEVLDIDERDAKALDSLTQLFRRDERMQDLADLYERRAELAESPEAAAPHRIELARLLEKDEATRDRALEQLDMVVQDLPTHPEAVAEIELRLEDPARKQRAIDLLRPIYQQQNDWEGLIRLNDQRLELLEYPMDKVDVLAETAALWEERGGEPEKAFAVSRMAFLLAPDHEHTRATVERLAEELDEWAELAASYEQAASQVEDDFVKRQLFDALAEVCDRRLDDPRRALKALGQLSTVDPSDAAPLERMDLLCMILSDWETLVTVLVRKADNAPGDDERAELLGRLAGIKRDMLEDPEGAIEVYEQALDLVPSSTGTLDRLVDLYRSRDGERLAELLEQRIEHAGLDEADEKHALILEAATVYAERLERPDDAIRMLQQALDDRPADLEVLRRLEQLYRTQSQSEALLDNLKAQAEAVEDGAVRADLRNKIGDLLIGELDNPFDALEQYRLVLEEAEGATADHAIAKARAIGERHEELRLDVSTLLEPVLRGAGDHAGLVDILELRLKAQTDPEDRASTLGAIAMLLEEQLERPAEARDALLRALAETPESPVLHGDIERLSELTGQWDRYAEALKTRADAIFDAVVQADLLTRLGRIAEERLDDRDQAIDAYARAADQADDPTELLASLDRLYLAAERWQELGQVLERRIDREVDGAAQADLLHRLGTLQIDRFDQPEIGLGTLRRAADLDAEHRGVREKLEELTDQESLFEEAAEALDAMYRVAGDNAARAKLRNKRIGYAPTPADRVRLRMDLAQMLEDETDDTKTAQDVIQQAFFDDPSEPELLAQIERLAAMNASAEGSDAWRRAADAVGEAVAQALAREERGEGDGNVTPEVARDLYLRSAGWYKEHCDAAEAAEKRLQAALEQDPRSGEALALLEAVHRIPGREPDLVKTLRRLAALAEGPEAMVDRASADLRREAKVLAEDKLDDADLAEAIVRDMLAADDGDVWALRELSVICARKNEKDELLKLLSRRIELMPEPDELRELRHEAARVAEELERYDESVDLNEQSFEDDPRDEVASEALRRLYGRLGRHEDMLRFTERLIDLSDDPQKRADLRLECARLCIEVLAAPSEGIDNLNAVLLEVPTHPGAVELLGKMLEKEGRDDELAELLEKQIELSREEGDQQKELGYRVKLAELYETRLNDPDRAIEGYLAVLGTDADFKPALEALARLYEQQDQKAKAAATLDKIVERADPAEVAAVALKAHNLHAASGDEEAAVAVLERALSRLEPSGDRIGEVIDGLRALYQKRSAWEALAGLIEKDAERADNDAAKLVAYRKAADIHAQKRDDHAAAATLLEKAHAINPDDRDIMLALCDEYTGSGRGKAAIDMLQKVVESYGGRRSKELADIHKRIASAYAADGSYEAALSELENARKMDPGSVAVLKELGMLSLRLVEGADEAAKAEHLKRAGNAFRSLLLQRLDDDAPITKSDIFYYLALVAHLGGNAREAKKNAERALSNDKEHEKAKALLAEIG